MTFVTTGNPPPTAPIPAPPNTPTPALARYDEACRVVAEARTVDDVQEITANAEAVRAYARQAKNRQVKLGAAKIRIRAERRLGELMLSQGGKAAGARGIGTSAGYKESRTPGALRTLAEAGIDKNLAHRARTLAAVLEGKIEEFRAADNHIITSDNAAARLALLPGGSTILTHAGASSAAFPECPVFPTFRNVPFCRTLGRPEKTQRLLGRHSSGVSSHDL
jgi:hypothetical protein